MQTALGILLYSPSDLIRFMESPFASWMDHFDRLFPGEVERDSPDESLLLVQQRGMAHEANYLAALEAAGRQVVRIAQGEQAAQQTLAAMRDGAEVIYQASLSHGRFTGYADFLVRVDGPSTLGDYHYEPWDTKLALHVKPYFAVQLCCYARMLEVIQGVIPQTIHVVLGDGRTHSIRTADCLGYYLQLEQAFLAMHESFDRDRKPEPEGKRDYGHWSSHATDLLEARDHLCRVANITRHQIRKLTAAGLDTMTALATATQPHVEKLDDDVFARLQVQARLQIASRGQEIPQWNPVPADRERPRRGLALLPPASPGDVFFDMEGYPYLDDKLEYLFGACTRNDRGELVFHDWWACHPADEQAAFEAFVDWVLARWVRYPDMHIFHYAAYEVTHLRRLMGKFGTRETEVDALLRGNVFVDLYAVVRQAFRVGTPDYSIKRIERLYRGARQGDVETAGDSMVSFQRWLVSGEPADWRQSAVLGDIRRYNRDDCESAAELAEWLWQRQRELGVGWVPPGNANGDDGEQAPSNNGPAPAAVRAELAAQMLASPPENLERQVLNTLLAQLLEFHRRDNKPVWWAQFDRAAAPDEELREDLDCLAMLERVDEEPMTIKRSRGYRYTFPEQETKMAAGKRFKMAHDLRQTGELHVLDVERREAVLKIEANKPAPPRLLSLIPDEFVDPKPMEKSIEQTVRAWRAGGALQPALEDLLLRRAPRLRGHVGEALTAAAAIDVVERMDSTTLCIQGPPGTGKTRLAAAVINALLQAGKRVAVSSNGHLAICHLMTMAYEGDRRRRSERAWYKVGSKENAEFFERCDGLEYVASSKELPLDAKFVGGTAWALSVPEMRGRFDYLFVDEAGQVSLANLVAMARCADNIVLLGDQMQLAQPVQGTHPGDSGMSALEYALAGHATVPPDRGIFLDVSYRMAPELCRFLSAAVYEGRLQAAPTTFRHRVVGARRESGLLFVPVEHEGNTQFSDEEAARVEGLLAELRGKRCVTSDGEKTLELGDVLVVAPYNMQVRRLRERLGAGARVGSVDLFQGQEAPVVILSMCASEAESVPRGLEFLLEVNRLNVALSRAQCLAIVVASPALLRTAVTSLERMKLVNLLCRVAEAGGIGIGTQEAVAIPKKTIYGNPFQRKS